MNESDPRPGEKPAGPAPPAADAGVSYEPTGELIRAELANPQESQSAPSPPEPPLEPPPPPRRRRIRLPLILFLLTCFSTFLAGATHYVPMLYLEPATGIIWNPGPIPVSPTLMPLRQTIYANWRNGVLYMACVLAILLTHEMGHFVMTLIYRVRASFPLFIPLPISPIGTMGAVIAMDARTANRRQIFDIGVAGPLAGLLVAIPIMWIGVQQMDLTPGLRGESLQAPLAMRLAIESQHPGEYDASKGFALTKANPWFMAGWVGLLVTGLNMLPVSQLDGGHVTYALFGRRAHWVARGFMALAFLYIGYMAVVYRTPTWVLMAILVMLIGTDHPPTSDDTVPLGWFRTALGYASLTIPIFCFVPNLML